MKHPKEMYLLALTEMCQRFAFWGIGNLLVIYLVGSLGYKDARADIIFGLYSGVSFGLPVLGGYLADRIGYRKPIVIGSISTSVGCILLALNIPWLLYPALFFAAIGGGVFTPAIYSLLGQVYHAAPHKREGGFTIYYSAVNIGVFSALVILGAIGQALSWSYAFLTAGIVQLGALVAFSYAVKNLKVTTVPAQQQRSSQYPLTHHEKERIAVILVLALFSIFFWLAYNQGGSSMSIFAMKYTDRVVGGFEMPPSWLLSCESFFLILLAYPLSSLYMRLRKQKNDPSPPAKTALSLFAIGLCFAVMMVGSLQIPKGATSAGISPLFLVGAYFLMAVGEMLIAPIGLSLITHLSPHRCTGMLVGIFYLCIGIAYYLGGAVATLMSKLDSITEFFALFVVGSFLLGILLAFLVPKLKKMRHLDTLG